jgi:hypothetical protein
MSSKNVKQIKIMVTTNISEKPFELTFSKIYNPAPGETPRRISTVPYPFFTADIEYPEKLLASKSYSEILHIFFDKQEFVKIIINNANSGNTGTTYTVDPLKQMENSNRNIMIMLKLLFPTSYPIKDNLNTSYRKYLLKKGPNTSFNIGDVSSMFSSGEVTALGKRQYSYINTEKGVCTVKEVIWLNDVLNNTLYRELIDKLIEYTEWAKTQNTEIKKELKEISKKLLDGLTPTGELLITEYEQSELENQKRIYNPDDIKKDITEIITKYLDIDSDISKTQKLNEEMGYLLDYFIDTHLKDPKSSPITQIVRFKDNFDFMYKTKTGVHDLFSLHKRYDGSDKLTKMADLNTEKLAKETDRDNLEKGYEKNGTWYFGKQQLDQYLKNLRELITSAQKQPMRNGKQNAPDDTTILRILGTGMTNVPANLNGIGTISVLPTVTYARNLFNKFPRVSSKNNSTFITEVNNRIAEITPNELKSMDEKISQLNVEIANLDKNIIESTKPNEEIFVFKGELDVPKEPIETIKKDNASTITKMQEEIFKSVITRYNRFQDIKRSSDLIGQYTEIDSTISVIVNEIQKLNELIKTSPSVDQILGITEPIKNSFDKLTTANKISISIKIGEKLAKIVKLSNQIKFLTQLETVFFKDPSVGIYVNYESDLEKNDSFTKLLFEEFKKEKYSNFINIVTFIKDQFLKRNVSSLNPILSKTLKEYFTNKSNLFYDEVIHPANLLINSGTPPSFSDPDIEKLWNVSITSLKSNTGDSEYEVSVYLDVIDGELNSKNKSEIKCQFLDEELTQRFEDLMDEGISYGPAKNTQIFSIKKAKDERVKHEQEKKKEIESAMQSKNNVDNKKVFSQPPVKGGKKNTKALRNKSGNYTRKLYT